MQYAQLLRIPYRSVLLASRIFPEFFRLTSMSWLGTVRQKFGSWRSRCAYCITMDIDSLVKIDPSITYFHIHSLSTNQSSDYFIFVFFYFDDRYMWLKRKGLKGPLFIEFTNDRKIPYEIRIKILFTTKLIFYKSRFMRK